MGFIRVPALFIRDWTSFIRGHKLYSNFRAFYTSWDRFYSCSSPFYSQQGSFYSKPTLFYFTPPVTALVLIRNILGRGTPLRTEPFVNLNLFQPPLELFWFQSLQNNEEEGQSSFAFWDF
jgi:hypothetical protein